MRHWILAVLPAVLVACGGHTAVPESTATGQFAVSSWPSAPQFVVARGSHATQYATVDGSGAFALRLPKGDAYALAVHLEGREVPVVFPRASGALDASFKVSSDGVAIALGAVRYLPAGAKPAFAVGGAGTCATGSVCVSEDPITCEDAQSAEGDQASNDTQGNADTSDQADSNAEIAVPEHDAPSDATGCDSQGSGGDQTDQEGEH